MRFNPNTPKGQEQLTEAFNLWYSTGKNLDELASDTGISRTVLSRNFSRRLTPKKEKSKQTLSHY